MGIAQTLLNTKAQCRHCDGNADLEFIEDGLIAAHVCPKRYVSRIIKYSERMDPKEFKDFVQGAVQNMEQVEDIDIRIARRYAWDLGIDRKSNDPILIEAYWTQSYRRTRNDKPDRLALFFCSNKDFFFIQPLNGDEKFCKNCRK
jgi:hypothetical protein